MKNWLWLFFCAKKLHMNGANKRYLQYLYNCNTIFNLKVRKCNELTHLVCSITFVCIWSKLHFQWIAIKQRGTAWQLISNQNHKSCNSNMTEKNRPKPRAMPVIKKAEARVSFRSHFPREFQLLWCAVKHFLLNRMSRSRAVVPHLNLEMSKLFSICTW